MPLTKKIILFAISTVLIFSTFSGCIFDDLFGSTEFSLSTWSFYDDDGFPALSLVFECTGTVTVKLITPNSKILDSDYFFKGDQTTNLYLADYRHSVSPGSYKLKVYDNDNEKIYSKTISVAGSDLTILSCQQKWWEREEYIGGFSLFGLKLQVYNSGDIPIYPYQVEVLMDSEEISSPILPTVILPGQTESFECFIYRESQPENSEFSVEIKDYESNTIGTGSYSLDLANIVPIKEFSWRFNNLPRKKDIPKSEYLYTYYSNLDRITESEYELYVFDVYDDPYIDIIIDEIMFGLTGTSDVNKINNVVNFVQGLGYRLDSETDSSYNYPNYPIETLFTGDGGGDCEDLSIITGNILRNMGYNVSLFIFENHMAVGINLSDDAVPDYDHYVDGYYFLEPTSEGRKCGDIPNDYKELSSDVDVYPLYDKPLLLHNWEDGVISIFTNTDKGDLVKVTAYIENRGSIKAVNFICEAGFYIGTDTKIKYETETISSLEPGMKQKIILSINIPKSYTTWFKTRLYLDGEVVDEKESISTFPT